MNQQPFQDELANRRRTALVLFYVPALLCVIAIGIEGKSPSFRTPLLALAIVGAGVATLFLSLS